MGEPRPDTPAADPPRPAASTARLSPLQQAYSDYVTHATRCLDCRDIDAAPCVTADVLWRAYRLQGDRAYRQLGDEPA